VKKEERLFKANAAMNEEEAGRDCATPISVRRGRWARPQEEEDGEQIPKTLIVFHLMSQIQAGSFYEHLNWTLVCSRA
jgi:hypothetical protein